MATESKDFKVKNGLQVGGPTNLVNYSSSSPSNPFVGQLWIDSDEDSPSGDLSSYLTLTAASALYLNIEDAQNTYLPISASSNFGGSGEYDPLGSASAAEFNAKAYADSLSVNYDSAGSASAAQTAAQNYADTQIFNLVDSAPSTLNTLNELAAALGDDANFAASTASALGDRLTIANASATYLTITNASNTYLPISASSNLGGGAVVEMSTTEPLDPEDGTLWVDTDSEIDTLNVNDYLRKDSASSTYLTIAESANIGGYARSFLLGGM